MERRLQEELEEKSKDILNRIEKIQKEFNDIHKIAAGTEIYWGGSAGKIHRDIEKEKHQESEEILNRLEERIKKVRAGFLGKTEGKTERKKETLPIDIFR